MEPFKREHSSYLTIKPIHESTPLIAGITTRLNGFSKSPYDQFNMGLHVGDEKQDVLANREKLADYLEFPMKNWVISEQVHSNNVKIVTDVDKEAGVYDIDSAIKGVDGLLTHQSGILLAGFFADCVPLYFHDPVTGWIGLAHAGWKGTVSNIGGSMIRKMSEEGVNPININAVIGPSISKQRYEVNEYVYRNIPQKYHEDCLTFHKKDHALLDLKALNERLLIDMGISENNIYKSQVCTYEADDLYSHRRDQQHTGRMLGFIGRY
ncbi:conserved hypothetical protein [Pelagirhabdus alkalitolerans]|uniref:Purine nucleoside phosphorylase n=2 Tax=Pelagirhabdus alkalitolerans TaxID=1612202 RepID=A0A1G6H2Q7_9BACI|nr:conserved hypothetical protein [Pelagirhabdus alkalitolerans]